MNLQTDKKKGTKENEKKDGQYFVYLFYAFR